MDRTAQISQLGECLAGVFQNRQQALAEPAQFVHLRLWIYPVPLFQADSFTFFLEQASAAISQPPYRQRVLRVRWLEDTLTAEYYALKQPHAFQGAAQSSATLQKLEISDLQPLSGSRLRVSPRQRGDMVCFEARHYPGEYCQFSVEGKKRYVQLGFDALAPTSSTPNSAAFWMYDKGIEPQTGKATWGALYGPFQLQKVEELGLALSHTPTS